MSDFKKSDQLVSASSVVFETEWKTLSCTQELRGQMLCLQMLVGMNTNMRQDYLPLNTEGRI